MLRAFRRIGFAMRVALFLFALNLLSLASATQAGEVTLPDAYRDQLEAGTKAGNWQAVAVGKVFEGETATWFFGHLEGHDGPGLDTHSRLEIGPLTEAYTGLLLADRAVGGKLRLGESLQHGLGDDKAIADKTLAGLSLEQLATYLGGLPAIPPNLFPRQEEDPFVDYGGKAFDALLARCACASGAAWNGSLMQFGLLGQVLGRETDFASLLRENVLAPLQLTSTGYGDTGLVDGHALGNSFGAWHYGALLGAGGLRSDLTDQLRLAQTLLRPGDSALRAAVLLARQPRANDSALGWHVLKVKSEDQEWPLLWNGGSSGGHASFLGFRVDRQEAVVLMGNSSADLTALGLAMLADLPPPEPPPILKRVDGKKAQAYAGLYQFAAHDELILRDAMQGLWLQRKGEFALELLEYDNDAFALPGDRTQLTFHRNEAGNIDELLLHENGLNRAAQRLTQRAPSLFRAAIDVDDQTLESCAGDFTLSSLEQLHVAPAGKQLRWQVSGGIPQLVSAFAADRYASADGDVQLRCARDEAGKVHAVELTLGDGERTAMRLDLPAPAMHEGIKEEVQSSKH
jgi:D-alanyl-D-alanine-carboxypeptidase/D-alanyl-D-alanine-endopeptidase